MSMYRACSSRDRARSIPSISIALPSLRVVPSSSSWTPDGCGAVKARYDVSADWYEVELEDWERERERLLLGSRDALSASDGMPDMSSIAFFALRQ